MGHSHKVLRTGFSISLHQSPGDSCLEALPPYPLRTINYSWSPHSWPRAKLHMCSAGPCPSHVSFTARSSCLNLRGNSSLLGTNVTVPGHWRPYASGHLRRQAPLACEGTSSINLGIMKMMSTWIFVILARYLHVWPRKCETPKESVQRPSQGTSRIM